MVAVALALIATVPASAVVPPTVTVVAPESLADHVVALEAAADRAEASPAAARRAASAVTELATNCPVHRATFVLLLALDRELAALDTRGLSASDRARFDLLVRGVRAQVRLLRSVGGDELPSPIVGDYLAGDYIYGLHFFRTGAELAASADPIADAEEILAQVPALASAMPGYAHDRVNAAWGVFRLTVPEQVWSGALSRWGEELRSLAPSLGERGARLSKVVDGQVGC